MEGEASALRAAFGDVEYDKDAFIAQQLEKKSLADFQSELLSFISSQRASVSGETDAPPLARRPRSPASLRTCQLVEAVHSDIDQVIELSSRVDVVAQQRETLQGPVAAAAAQLETLKAAAAARATHQQALGALKQGLRACCAGIEGLVHVEEQLGVAEAAMEGATTASNPPLRGCLALESAHRALRDAEAAAPCLAQAPVLLQLRKRWATAVQRAQAVLVPQAEGVLPGAAQGDAAGVMQAQLLMRCFAATGSMEAWTGVMQRCVSDAALRRSVLQQRWAEHASPQDVCGVWEAVRSDVTALTRDCLSPVMEASLALGQPWQGVHCVVTAPLGELVAEQVPGTWLRPTNSALFAAGAAGAAALGHALRTLNTEVCGGAEADSAVELLVQPWAESGPVWAEVVVAEVESALRTAVSHGGGPLPEPGWLAGISPALHAPAALEVVFAAAQWPADQGGLLQSWRHSVRNTAAAACIMPAASPVCVQGALQLTTVFVELVLESCNAASGEGAVAAVLEAGATLAALQEAVPGIRAVFEVAASACEPPVSGSVEPSAWEEGVATCQGALQAAALSAATGCAAQVGHRMGASMGALKQHVDALRAAAAVAPRPLVPEALARAAAELGQLCAAFGGWLPTSPPDLLRAAADAWGEEVMDVCRSALRSCTVTDGGLAWLTQEGEAESGSGGEGEAGSTHVRRVQSALAADIDACVQAIARACGLEPQAVWATPAMQRLQGVLAETPAAQG